MRSIFLILIVVDKKVKTHQTVYFKYVQSHMSCQLYLNKAVQKKKKKTECICQLGEQKHTSISEMAHLGKKRVEKIS